MIINIYNSIIKNCLIKFKQCLFYFTLCFCVTFIFSSCSNNPNNNINLAELGNKYFVEHNYGEALKIYEEAIKEGYKSLDVFYNSGFIYHYEKKDFKKAEELYKKGLLIYPNEEVFHFALSQLYFTMDNLTEAVKEYKLAVKLAGGRPLTINANKAKELLKKEGKNDSEIYNFFLKIIEFNPKDTMALYEIAEYEQKEKRFEDALEKYKKIVKLDPRMKEHLALEMGICYYNLKDYKTALDYFEKAKKTGDLVPEVFINKAKENIAAQQRK